MLRLLLEHGGDTSMRSQYNKNAHDLAKDELDAALNVVTDKSEIRAVILEHDQGPGAGRGLFGKAGPAVLGEQDMYHGLGTSGSPVVMQLELLQDAQAREGGKPLAGGKKGDNNNKAGGGSKAKKGPKKST